MSKGIKFKDNIYLDSSGIMHNRQALKNILNSLIPVVLYNNSSGSNGTITLSETSANFSYIEIFYKTNTGDYASIRVYQPNGKAPTLSMIDDNGGDYTTLWAKYTRYLISGTTITPVRKKWMELGTTNKSDDDNTFLIYRVLGYR